MRSRPILYSSGLLLVLLVSLLLIVLPVAAQNEGRTKPKTKRVQAVGEWTYKRLLAAHEAIAAGNYPEALAKLDELKGSSRLNAHEEALMWQSYGYVYGSSGKYPEAAEAFEKCLAKNALPETAQSNVQFNVAQLYVVLERYDDAVALFRSWFATVPDPSPDAHYIFAVALFQSGDKAGALEHGLAAIDGAKVPKEAWLQLVLSARIDSKNYAEAVGTMEALVGLYPKKAYWLQLSALYAETEDYPRALAAMAIAYDQGLLTEKRELEHLAQLYLYNRIPFPAALVLERAIDDRVIPESAESWQLLADSWVTARERQRARKPLEEAASRSTTGELFSRLAQVQVEQEEWGSARKSLLRALEKGGLSDPANAQLLLGIASANDEKWAEAQTAFQAAAGFEQTAAAAKQWLAETQEHLKPDPEAVQPAEVGADPGDDPGSAEGQPAKGSALAAPPPAPHGKKEAAAPRRSPPAGLTRP